MSGGSDFEMTKTQAFYVLEELKKFTEVVAVKDEIWDIQKQINRLDEFETVISGPPYGADKYGHVEEPE